MSTYTLYAPLIDWLTITSFEPAFYGTQQAISSNLIDSDYNGKRTDGTKRLQYLGWTVNTDMGSAFFGSATQKGRDHYMTTVSGELCNEDVILLPLSQGIREGGWMSVRRIDFQVTIPEPNDWEQWALFNRQKRARKSVGWIESRDKASNLLQTVYVGSRRSEKMLRVYEKMGGKTRLLRTEWEIKGNTAESYARALMREGRTVSELLKMLVQQLNDAPLTDATANALDAVAPINSPRIVRNAPKTEIWLLETVLPAFVRHINDHASDSGVIDAFQDAIDNTRKWDFPH